MKWAVATTRGLVHPSEAFTLNELGAQQVYGLTEEFGGFWAVAG